MDENLDIFTKDGKKIGIMPKKFYYSQTGEVPWIKCCSCFVVDKNENKILFEKRGNTFIDAGKLDLCSGHVKSGEAPRIAMTRELNEELGIPTNISSTVNLLGEVLVDYSNLSDPTTRRNMKCITSMYTLGITDLSQIHIDNEEVVRYAWLSLKDARGFIENGMTRLPYDDSLKMQYDMVFKMLDKFMNKNRDGINMEKE